MKLFSLILILLAQIVSSVSAYELKAGDTVAFLGDAFMEREQYGGWIELAATTQFPDRDILFRNLGWSADTPAGLSRNGLSVNQAGHEAEGGGWQQLRKQLETYKPTVIILGYGMAASLSDNCTPAEFAVNLDRLIDEAPQATGAEVRFLILGTPPRFKQAHENEEEWQAREASRKAIEAVLSQTAEKRNFPYINLSALEKNPSFSQNGIHLTSDGYKATARLIEKALDWQEKPWDQGEQAEILRQHILKKNEWFFNRSRPANMAYIFGFRSQEQGNNAKEIPQFDALVAKEEASIFKMRDLTSGTIVPLDVERTESAIAAHTPQPHPNFTVADGFEVTLWAENPLIHKPTQINFDPQGRLWVASSETYPMVEVGQTANDKVIVLEDTDGSGTADKSTIFADGMMMPTAVLPGDGGVYVAQSTDLLHFKDTNGDGKADVKTRVLSGFGTEDTHHNLHTLRRGPDGRIWMSQSVYTRSDIETPKGVVRLRAGGVFRFDPRDSKLEIMYRGFWNTWGHHFDEYGQSFLTDGADGNGINWAFPGATFAATPDGENIFGSVSPGKYPKLSGLEIINSEQFPAEWQGNLVSCDFRAHRVVRFSIADEGAGYVTQELSDLLRSEDVNFRPIDVKTGPDGALYIADWSNPIINHGEVDFRDPRRDREHGRIWRVAKKDQALVKKVDFSKLSDAELAGALTSKNSYSREQATAVLFDRNTKPDFPSESELEILAALRFGVASEDLIAKALASSSGPLRASAIRALAESPIASDVQVKILEKTVGDAFPRVRLESVLALSKIPGVLSFDVALRALDSPTDRFINYALWLATRKHGAEWLEHVAIQENTPPEKLSYVLSVLPVEKASATLTRIFPATLPKDGSGPWLALGLKNGNSEVISAIYKQAVSNSFDEKSTLQALGGIESAILQRQIKLTAEVSKLAPLIEQGNPAAISLAGALADEALLPNLVALASKSTDATSLYVIEALGNFPSALARDAILLYTVANEPPSSRTTAILALARHHRETALPLITSAVQDLSDPVASRSFWQRVLSNKDISTQLAKAFSEKPLSAEAASLALASVPDVKDHDELLKVLRAQANDAMSHDASPQKIAELVAAAKEKGDPHRGELIYRNPVLACTACHAIGGAGGVVGPDMTSIGASAPLDYLVESVLNPGVKVKEGYHSVIIETKDGKSVNGSLIRSIGGSLVVRDASGAEVTIAENNVAKKTDAGSLMPPNLINSLDAQQTSDLFAFLSQLGRPGDFSASDSNAPRIYALLEANPDTEKLALSGDPSLPWAVFNATVNGRLLPTEVEKFFPNPNGKEMFIATKLQLTEATDLALILPEDFKPTALWIDGKLALDGKASIPAGIHIIVTRAHLKEAPVRFQSKKGTFLPKW